MNNLRSGKQWLTVMDVLGEQAQPLLINFLCINVSYFDFFLQRSLRAEKGYRCKALLIPPPRPGI